MQLRRDRKFVSVRAKRAVKAPGAMTVHLNVLSDRMSYFALTVQTSLNVGTMQYRLRGASVQQTP
jgi:hypothetical protein